MTDAGTELNRPASSGQVVGLASQNLVIRQSISKLANTMLGLTEFIEEQSSKLDRIEKMLSSLCPEPKKTTKNKK